MGFQRIEPAILPLGEPLPANLYDADGRLLWRVGDVLEALDLQLASGRLRNGMFADGKITVGHTPMPMEPEPQPDPAEPERRVIDLRMLGPGSTLVRDIYDERGILLLSAGKIVTEKFLSKLRARGLTTVRAGDLQTDELPIIHEPCEPSPPAAPHEHALPTPAATPLGRCDKSRAPAPIRLDPAAAQRIDRLMTATPLAALPTLAVRDAATPGLELGRMTEIVEAGRAYVHRSREMVELMSERAARGQVPDAAQPMGVVDRFAALVRIDADAALHLLAGDGRTDDYLLNHALNVSLLAMAAADRVGLSSPEVRAVGLGAMMQDLGMLQLPSGIRLAHRALDAQERAEVAMHPLYTLQMLERMSRLDDLTRIVAYQSHERCDGSGYPNRTPHTGIHPLARLIAAADTYCALTCARPHRDAMPPHDAVRHLLVEAHAGRLDRDAVRALLHTLGAFPVGSIVTLNDGRCARVIRSGRQEMTRPTVRILSPTGHATDEVINLSRRHNLNIIAADAKPQAA